ncbi:MAG: flagellar filament capping protein FliD [Burkholderiales bacterium]|nr:flagellar filament capping protein FliD [Burkholderiales bacterium]
MANSLVDAERAPRADAINKNISKNQAVISGYSAVKYALSNLQAAFDDLKDKSDYKSIAVSNSQTSAFTATASASADAGSHTVLITQLAAAQRNTGTQTFATADTAITGLTTLTLGGAGFPVVSGAAQTIAVTTATPTGVVDAINNSGKGLSAQLVNTGNGYKIVVTGASGASNAFSVTSDAADGLNFSTSLQTASNAALTVDGIPITSSSNSVTGAIAGVTLDLIATNGTSVTSNGTTTVTGTPASLNLANDTSAAKTKVMALVTAYNDANSLLDEVTNPKSTLATYGATLVGNSSVRAIRDQIRAMVTDDSSTKASSGTLSALRDIGIEVDKTGNLTANSVTLDLALNFNFTNTVTLLSGNQENQASFDTSIAGIAGDASKALTTMMGSSGTLTTESANATARITKYQDDLTALEDRMTRLLDRYTKQFAAMDSMVGQIKSTQTGLTSSFAGLMAMYTNK